MCPFTLLAGTRRTYGQMIRALSKLPEVAGLSPEGHAASTAMLAATMARGMGMHPDDVTQLEYAALLHDIGRITVEDPADEPATSDLARWGAEIIRQAPYLRAGRRLCRTARRSVPAARRSSRRRRRNRGPHHQGGRRLRPGASRS